MVREFDQEDINIINVLGRYLSPNYLFQINTVRRCLVYDLDGQVVGFITYDLYDDRAEIIDLVVHINYRNQGIGSKLVNKVINNCVNNRCKNITLEVKCNNKSAVNLYKTCSFKIISTRKRYYDNGQVDAYLMLREL